MADDSEIPTPAQVAQLCIVCGEPALSRTTWRGPTPKYCAECRAAVLAERNRVHMRRLRETEAYRTRVRKYTAEWKERPLVKARLRDKAKRERERNPERNRWDHRKRRYGLERHDIEAMYERQLASCALCFAPLPFDRMHVDHDHATGEVRGLLHPVCNMTLGRYGDRY